MPTASGEGRLEEGAAKQRYLAPCFYADEDTTSASPCPILLDHSYIVLGGRLSPRELHVADRSIHRCLEYPIKPDDYSVDTVLSVRLLPCNHDFPRLDRSSRPKSAATRSPGTSGINIAGAPLATFPSLRSAQGRASSPTPIVFDVDGVDGAPVTRLWSWPTVHNSASGAACAARYWTCFEVTSVVSLGKAKCKFPSAGVSTSRVEPPGQPQVGPASACRNYPRLPVTTHVW